MSATLTASCPSCPYASLVPAEAIFDFDARCPDCREVLNLEDGEEAEEGELDTSLESGEFDCRERPTLTDADEIDPDQSTHNAHQSGSPFQGLGVSDHAGLDILALAASALDPDVDLSAHQFGGVREVPEVRLGENGGGGILAPTDSSRLRHQQAGSGSGSHSRRTPSGRLYKGSGSGSHSRRTPSGRLAPLQDTGPEDEIEDELARASARLSFDEIPPEDEIEDDDLILDEPAPNADGGETSPTDGPPLTESATASVALLKGEVATAPPLPSWEGGDTQQVGTIAASDPGSGLLPPLVQFDTAPLAETAERRSPLDPLPEPETDLDEIAALVEIPKRSTSARMSRVYDAAQVVGADGAITLPPDSEEDPPSLAETVPPTAAFGSGSAETQARDVVLGDDTSWDAGTEERISRLFQDADWLALLDDTVTEVEGQDDSSGRRVIRLSETEAAEAQTTFERDGAAALEALLLGSTSDSRSAQRFPKDALQPPTAHFKRNDLKGNSSEPTQSFKTLAREEQADGQPTKSFQRPDDLEGEGEGEGAKTGPDTQVWKTPRRPPASSERPRPSPRSSSSSRLQALSSSRSAIRPRMIVEQFHRDQLDPGLVCVSDVEAPESDLFRQLYEQVFHGANLDSDVPTHNGERSRVILVTSARPAEGKTIVASNLAVVGARVPGEGAVLVNADPRGRGILRAFGQRAPTDGLLEALSTDSDPSRYVVRLRLNELDVIPLGLRGSNAAELIASDSMRTFIDNLRRVYPRQSILIDGSSVLGAADPLALARMVDKVLLVVRARKTSKTDIEQAIRLIGRSRLAGIVLNDVLEAA
ncbi:MAG: CpsD/CapB family tyrosine-protein kinase [Planctomycetes bacterium]|nr:CpsD/CapB family tyrosine-protein kinase [Planctomycetota bacterium]